MTLDELQLIADTAWIMLGSVGQGVIVRESLNTNCVCIEFTAVESGCTYVMSEMITRHLLEMRRGSMRFNYIEEITMAIRKSISGYYSEQIKLKL